MICAFHGIHFIGKICIWSKSTTLKQIYMHFIEKIVDKIHFFPKRRQLPLNILHINTLASLFPVEISLYIIGVTVSIIYIYLVINQLATICSEYSFKIYVVHLLSRTATTFINILGNTSSQTEASCFLSPTTDCNVSYSRCSLLLM